MVPSKYWLQTETHGLPSLPFQWWPPLAATHAHGLYPVRRRYGSVALSRVREALPCPVGSAAQHPLRAMRQVRQPGTAKDFGGICAGAAGTVGTDVGVAGVAVRSMQA
jgi:hypothetical protein